MPRKGVTPQWREQLADILSAQKLSQVALEQRPPTLVQLRAALPNAPDNLLAAVVHMTSKLWWTEATRLYLIVRSSIDLSGIYEARDLETIKSFSFGDWWVI